MSQKDRRLDAPARAPAISSPMISWLELVIGGLACFRLALLLSEDSGPAKMFERLRSLLRRQARAHPAVRKTDVAEGIQCIRCSSVWVALPVALYALCGWRNNSVDVVLLCMALSACAILLNRAFKP